MGIGSTMFGIQRVVSQEISLSAEAMVEHKTRLFLAEAALLASGVGSAAFMLFSRWTCVQYSRP